jgi:hypothetical protein
MREFGVAIFLLMGIFGGYGVYQHFAAPLISAQDVASSVGSVYGDSNPQIVRQLATTTDGATHEPMYTLILRGHFREGAKTAKFLEFSALASRQYAWGLWAGNTPPASGGHRAWKEDVVQFAGKNHSHD